MREREGTSVGCFVLDCRVELPPVGGCGHMPTDTFPAEVPQPEVMTFTEFAYFARAWLASREAA